MKPRGTNRRVFALVALLLALGGCAATQSHNVHGGYIPACGDKPPLIGDDC